MQNALLKAILGDFVDQLRGVGDCQFLRYLVLDFLFDLLGLHSVGPGTGGGRGGTEESHFVFCEGLFEGFLPCLVGGGRS